MNDSDWKSPLSDADTSKKIVAHWREHIKFKKEGDERFIAYCEIAEFEDGRWCYRFEAQSETHTREVPLDAVYVEVPNPLWPEWVEILTPETQREVDAIKASADLRNRESNARLASWKCVWVDRHVWEQFTSPKKSADSDPAPTADASAGCRE